MGKKTKYVIKACVFLTVENDDYVRRKEYSERKTKSQIVNELFDKDRLGQSATEVKQ